MHFPYDDGAPCGGAAHRHDGSERVRCHVRR